MADTRKNRFSFDKHYYEGLRRDAVEGSVARAVDATRKYEDYYDDSELFSEEYQESDFETTSPLKREKAPEQFANSPRVSKGKAKKIKASYSFGFLEVLMIVILLAAIVNACYAYIEARAENIQLNKKIQVAKDELADIQNKNLALQSQLDVETDRNYIYTIAVSKLNMIYPKENDTIYYNRSYDGYVRQYYEIPAVK